MNLIPWQSEKSEEDQVSGLPLVAFRNEMDRLFDTFFREPFGGLDWPFGGRAQWMPSTLTVCSRCC
jgi:hypothetical protein